MNPTPTLTPTPSSTPSPRTLHNFPVRNVLIFDRTNLSYGVRDDLESGRFAVRNDVVLVNLDSTCSHCGGLDIKQELRWTMSGISSLLTVKVDTLQSWWVSNTSGPRTTV